LRLSPPNWYIIGRIAVIPYSSHNQLIFCFPHLFPSSNYPEGITTDDYDRKCQELKNRQYNINEQIKSYLKADETFKITANTVLSIASKAYDLFLSSTIEQKRKLISYVFSNLELKGVTLQYSLKKPFDLMVNCSTYQEWLGD